MKTYSAYVGGVAALFVGLIICIFAVLDRAPATTEDNSRPLAECTSEISKQLAPEKIDLVLLYSILDLCRGRTYDEARLRDFQIRRAKFSQQTYDERILLWMVVVITFSGVGLAALQLYTSFKLAIAGPAGGSPDTGSEFSLEKGKIALKSSVTGLFVLIFSFAFFYVFVYEIYVIKEIDAASDLSSPTAAVQIPGSESALIPASGAPKAAKP